MSHNLAFMTPNPGKLYVAFLYNFPALGEVNFDLSYSLQLNARKFVGVLEPNFCFELENFFHEAVFRFSVM